MTLKQLANKHSFEIESIYKDDQYFVGIYGCFFEDESEPIVYCANTLEGAENGLASILEHRYLIKLSNGRKIKVPELDY